MTDQPATMQEDLRLSEERTELSLERTREAAERTLMAWIRTSLAMIGFGFGTFKLSDLLLRDTHQEHRDTTVVQWFTLGLVVWGTLLLIGAIVEYSSTMKRLKRPSETGSAFPLVLIGAAGIACFGMAAIVHLFLTLP